MALFGLFARYPFKERRRAIVKTLSYRTVVIAITIVVAWVVAGSTADAVNIGIAANVVKTGTYYVYERLWDRIARGIHPAEPTS